MRKPANILIILGILFSIFTSIGTANATEDSRYFSQTDKTVSGKFLEYWDKNGGLPVFGYPITEAQMEVNPEDGQVYLTQWFERHRFELHPEKAGTPFEILTGLLGKDLKREGLSIDPDFLPAAVLYNTAQPKEQQWYFDQTKHNLRFRFLEYWMANGGLERFGYPISEEYKEVDPETGNVYIVQWFERARFEYHPENQRPYDVLLGLLGKQIKNAKPGDLNYLWKIGAAQNDLRAPGPIAVGPDGSVYVADSGTRIQKYDGDGHFLARWGTAGLLDGQFNGINSLAIDSKNNVYVLETNRVQKFSSDGTFLLKFGAVGSYDAVLDTPTQMVIDPQGNIFIIERSKYFIKKFDSNGKYLKKFGGLGTQDSNFQQYPERFKLDSQGNLFVQAGDSLQKFDKEGNALQKWQGTAFELSFPTYTDKVPFSRLTLLQITPEGYFSLYYGINNMVYVVDSNLTILKKWTPLGGISNSATDGVGNLYLSGEMVYKYDSSGNFILKWGAQNSQSSLINNWYNISADYTGNLYYPDNSSIVWLDENLRETQRVDFASLTSGQFNQSIGRFSFDNNGNIYVLLGNTESTKYLQVFDSAGHSLNKWTLGSCCGWEDGKIDQIYDFEVGGNGNFYLIDYYNYDANHNYSSTINLLRVQAFDNRGNFMAKWLVPFSYIGLNLTTDPQGNLYILSHSDADKGTDRGTITKYNGNGNVLGKWDLAAAIHAPSTASPSFSLVSDHKNSLYLTARSYDQSSGIVEGIIKLSFDGQLQAFWQVNDPKNTDQGDIFGVPYGNIVATSNGAIFVKTYTAIQKFRIR
ncbi:MAG: hypothetical protein HXX08_16875 [Chloroflexi bacterium]|uniref:6-bladed beta-propeller n=1 Tax=Candidatus Chlorohelix allophototropha TaxID=3003348 RepID=A0A8T7M613_9CHLR|nr:hypothetical protein [Chloroflexota bacterium]WJW69445.1 hypothetical protein OZ401_003057 [Chloroflexota bacterium L227-S17]